MGFHTFDASRADSLEEASRRYRHLSREELLAALAPGTSDVVLDVGSGTGFYTDDVAPHVERVVAVDVQPAMHAYYSKKGLPANVDPVTAVADALPFADNSFDGAFSTMTFHEFATEDALRELDRVVRSSGRIVLVDWSKDGEGEAGPPVSERFTPGEATAALDTAGFAVDSVQVRSETFVVVATVGVGADSSGA